MERVGAENHTTEGKLQRHRDLLPEKSALHLVL